MFLYLKSHSILYDCVIHKKNIVRLLFTGHRKVVHLTGIEGTIVPNSSRSFSVCGVNFEKAAVKEEQFWSVVGDSKADINNKNERTNRYSAYGLHIINDSP